MLISIQIDAEVTRANNKDIHKWVKGVGEGVLSDYNNKDIQFQRAIWFSNSKIQVADNFMTISRLETTLS